MKKMKLSVKLIGSFCLVSLMLLVGGYIGVANIVQLKKNVTTIYEVNTKPLVTMGDIAELWQELRAEIRSAYIQKFVYGRDMNRELEKIAALNEKLATVRDFLVYYASCPCCQALEKCADDCTFENDVPADHEVMTQAREILREVGHD